MKVITLMQVSELPQDPEVRRAQLAERREGFGTWRWLAELPCRAVLENVPSGGTSSLSTHSHRAVSSRLWLVGA